MKKILAWVLVLVLVVGMLAGCGCQKRPEEPTPTDPSVEAPTDFVPEGATAEEAMKYLRAIYKDTEEPTPTPVNYDRYGIVRIAGIPFTVVWTVDVSEDLIKIVVNEDGSVTIDVNEQCEVATPYTLTATITDAQGNTASHSWDMILPAAVDMAEIVNAAYELAPGESLPYQSTLRGKITAINTVYSAEYKNITVTIEVEGAEGKPVMCYRLKGDGIDKLLVGNIITVTGTLKNYNGTIEFDAGCTLDAVEEGEAVEAITDPGEILKAAYALKEDTQLPNPATLTGTVIEIDSPYDPSYGNISVVIEVEGYPQYPILCYRMKGVDVSKIAVKDLITVTGIIKNYKGTIEFDAGCQMTNRVSGGGVAEGPSSDQNKILSDASKLGVGEKLPYIATLTGEIYSVDTPYSAEYGNVTVTMLVGGKKIQCFRMVGDGVDQIRETDTITVTGIIENYNGKLEFGAKCNLDSWTKGPRNVNYGPLKEETAYRLYVKQTAIEKTLYFDGTYSGSRLNTSSLGSEGVDIFAERVSGKGMRFYFMDGETKTYIEVEDYTNDEGKVRGRTVVTTSPKTYWTYDSTLGVYVVTVQAGKHFLGTYSTYETISASWTGYIDGTMSGSSQYIAKFMLASDVPADDAPALAYGTYTTSPEVGVAYKLGLDQTTKEATYYFTGKMSNYYGATEADYSKGVDVYLENAEGGYYLYFTDANGAKQYVYIVASSDGAHINFTYTTSNKSVFTYDTELNSLYTTVGGAVYYMGTYGSYVTVGTTAQDKAASSYVTHLYTSGTGGNAGGETPDEPDVPVVPDDPATEVTELEEGKAYNMMMVQGNLDKTLYLAGGLSGEYWTTTEDASAAASVYAEKEGDGYRFYYMDGETKTYIEAYLNSNGKPRPQMSTTPSQVWTYDEEAGVFTVEMNGSKYYMGTYSTYDTISVSGTYYITGDNAANKGVSQFYVVFVDPSASGGETPDTPDTPATGTGYYFGMVQENVSATDIYYLKGGMSSYYMATSTNVAEAIVVYMEETDGGCYLYTMVDGVKTYINMVVSGTHVNGAYETTASTVYTYDAEKNTVIAQVDGADYWFGTRNDNTYTTVGPCKVEYNGFYCKFYPAEGGETPDEPDTPDTPDEPVTGTTATLITELPKDGDVIVIVNGENAMTATASGNKLASEAASITNGVLTLTETQAQLTVSVDANGYYTFTTADSKYLTSGATGNSLSLADAASDYSLWTVEAATEGTWYIKNVNAKYNGNVQSLEVYQSNFTTFGHKDNSYYQMQLFGVAAEPAAPTSGQLMTTAPVDGDIIAIVNGSIAMTATASGNKLASEAASITDDLLTLTETQAHLTVSVDANGYYTFTTADGKYLTSGATGNSLSLADAASDYSLWTVEAATDGTWYIKNVNAKYNGNVQSLEVYQSNFTTFGHKDNSYYQMQLYKLGTGSATAPEIPEEDASDYTEMTIAEAREAATGTKVKVSGIVARITYANGMKPSGVILVDDTASIYVYDSALANQCAIGNTVSLCASKTYWILESEQSNAAKYGYQGCNQLEEAKFVEVEATTAEFNKTWIEESTVKEILDTPVTTDITSKIFKVTALVKEKPGSGFTNYYFYDLDGTTGAYTYSQCNGSDFSWLREFDGKVCTVYIMALNAKSSASDCYWRFLPVEVVDEGFDASTVNFAENAVKLYGVPQFLSEYTGDPAKELLASADNELLGYTGAKLTYVSSDPSVVSIDENVLHCHKSGTVQVTVTAEHNGVTYSEDVTIVVDIFDVNAEFPTVAEAVAAELDATVTVKGVVGPSLVNKSGFYLIDDTGVIAVLVDSDTLATLEIGYEVILEGTREYHSKSGSSRGNSCLNNIKVLHNGYGNHAYSTASFDGTLTLAEFAALSVDTDYTTSVYTVTATVEVVETSYYTSIKLVDGETSINLYSSSAAQYTWLQAYAGQEITMELAPCNWSSKSVYPACVLAVVHADGTKTVNSLNFN